MILMHRITRIFTVLLSEKDRFVPAMQKAASISLQQLGIYCIYVTGQTTDPNGGVADHAWNIVQCNGQYYYVDATWGDPIFLGEDNGYQIPNLIAYDYLFAVKKRAEKKHI